MRILQKRKSSKRVGISFALTKSAAMVLSSMLILSPLGVYAAPAENRGVTTGETIAQEFPDESLSSAVPADHEWSEPGETNTADDESEEMSVSYGQEYSRRQFTGQELEIVFNVPEDSERSDLLYCGYYDEESGYIINSKIIYPEDFDENGRLSLTLQLPSAGYQRNYQIREVVPVLYDWILSATSIYASAPYAITLVESGTDYGEANIEFTDAAAVRQTFSRNVGEADISSTYLNEDEMKDVRLTDMDGRVIAYQGSLSGVGIKEREAGERAGTYALTTLSSNSFSTLHVVQNDNAVFTINKRTEYVIDRDISYVSFGAEESLSLTEGFAFDSQAMPATFSIGEMKSDSAALFTEAPVIEGTTLRFALTSSGTSSRQVDIPIILSNDEYEYRVSDESETDGYRKDLVYLHITLEGVHTPAYHSPSDIIAFANAHPFSRESTDTYAVQPDINSETAGRLSTESDNNTLNAMNCVRYAAGIPADVTVDETYEQYAQAGTLLDAKAGQLNHTPSNPGFSDAFYRLGYTGTSSSNLASGYWGNAASTILGYMDDTDRNSIGSLGHRRWVLNPSMQKTGFGEYQLSSRSGYYAMYAFDHSRSEDESTYAYVAWPSTNTPTEYLAGDWNFSFNDRCLSVSQQDLYVDIAGSGYHAHITLADQDVSGNYLYLNNVGYGMGPAVIFRFGHTFTAGDQVQVTIGGLRDQLGGSVTISYTVNLFSLAQGRKVFDDVPTSGKYYSDAVYWAYDNGITSGTSATTFGPDDACTRGQMVQFLYRLSGEPAVSGAMAYTDVPDTAYYRKAVIWAASRGITTGTSATTFGPDQTCTRAQMVQFLYKMSNSPAVSGNSSFTDVAEDAWYRDAVIWAVQKGITSGKSATEFGSKDPCTRGQMVQFLYRMTGH